MEEAIFNIVVGALVIVGLGVVLKYLAFMIAWGVAEGWAKVTHVITQTHTYKQSK